MNTDPPDHQQEMDARIRELEAELTACQQRIHQLEESWEQWLRIISHDLRGPLTLILGYTQTALHGLRNQPSSSRARQDLEAVVTAARRLDKMVAEIVDAARLEAHLLMLSPTAIELAPIVSEQVRRAGRRYPDRVIENRISSDLPLVEGDPSRVGQIIAEILSNALIFSTCSIHITAHPEPGRVVLAVTDRGVGITPDEMPRIFDRFYRAERCREIYREGLGLGLHVAQQLARHMGGDLWAESPGTGCGSTFYLSLPIADSPVVDRGDGTP
ncbi:MAG TPA: ATP-binding protein [Chloroflexota bacterium]|nr:ATP-binding protein [Chloroflexota bacterium]